MAISQALQREGRSMDVRYLLPGPLLIGIVAVVVSVAVVKTSIGRTRGPVVAPPRGIAIEPTSLRLTDRKYTGGDTVIARYSFVNRLDRPVVIGGIHTLCSCMATLPDAAASGSGSRRTTAPRWARSC